MITVQTTASMFIFAILFLSVRRTGVLAEGTDRLAENTNSLQQQSL